MLHWPDSMVSYIPEDKLLICNDAFGQNIASTERYADEIDRSALLHAMKEYYHNIVLPFSPIVLKTLDAIAELKLDIDMLAPDHGLIFRGYDEVRFAFDTYRRYAEQKPQKRAVIVFDTMWHSTEKMAHAIADGLEAGGVPTRIMWLKANHHSAVMTELADCGAVIVGSPTHNNGILPAGKLCPCPSLSTMRAIAGCEVFVGATNFANCMPYHFDGVRDCWQPMNI